MNNRADLINPFKAWNEFVLDIVDMDWSIPIAEGKWTIHDVVSHIMLWDKYFYESTIEPIVSDKVITLELIDFDAFNQNAITYGKTRTKEDLIESTTKYRSMILECINSLDEAKYSKKYVEGRFSFESYLMDFISHDLHHMKQIEKLKKTDEVC